MSVPRFNLRNASLFLNKLKNKYTQNKLFQQNRDNTFIDQQQQFSSSRLSVRKKSSQLLDLPSDRLQTANNQNEQEKFEEQQIEDQKRNKKDMQISQDQTKLSVKQQLRQQQKSRKQQTQFCDLIVIKYLQETLTVYKSDLQILEHNRQNLQQQIYFLGKKIGKLHQISSENTKLETEIQQLNKQLKEVIQQYHQTNKIAFKKKLEAQKIFKKVQKKLKSFVLLGNYKEDVMSFNPDCLAMGYADVYSQFLEYKKDQQLLIAQKTQQLSKQDKNNQNKEKEKFFKKLFEGKETLYLNENNKQQKQQPTTSAEPIIVAGQKKKEKKIILYDEGQQNDQGQQKRKNKEKTRKLSESERAMLLGDLKNFSKSFKIPK